MTQPPYTIKEVQGLLKCSRSKVVHLINDGQLERIKIGGMVRISAASVEKLINPPKETA